MISNKHKRFMIVTAFICILLEVIVFNYKSYVTIGGDYKKTYIPVSNAVIYGFSYGQDGSYIANRDNPSIEFEVNREVKTMGFDIARKQNRFKAIDVGISYSYQGHKLSQKQPNRKFEIVDGDKRTQYVTCSYFGDAYKIKLTIDCKSGESFMINGLTVNDTIPFRFSMLRLIGLWFIINFIYLLMKYPTFGKPYDLKNKSHKYCTVFIVAMLLILNIVMLNMYVGKFDMFTNTDGNQMTKELVDAFENGQVSLMDEVPESLLALENPYDITQRNTLTESIKWDHLLYNGKYYSYYGIGPVITLFLPYHLITGYYFSAPLAVILFNLVGTLFLCLAYLSVMKHWFKKVPYNITVMGMLMIVMGSGILHNLICPQFYEIAQSAGLCFMAVGFYFMVNSGIFMKKTIRKSMLFWSAFFMSLAVLSRAVSALYAITMVCWIGYGLLQNNKDKGKSAKEIVKYLAAAMLPYVVFGLIQMLYNYARFGSPFDFGIQYTLTIYDYSSTQISLALVMVSIVNFFFALPLVNTTFPFIHNNLDMMNLNGYYFVATQDAVGLIPRVLPILSFLYTPKVAKRFDRKDKIKYALIWFIPGVIFPIIIAAMTWQYGYAIRYTCDFAPAMILAALVLAYYVYIRIKNETVKKWLGRIMLISTMWCVAAALAVAFKDTPTVKTAIYDNPKGALLWYHIKNLIMFWN